MAKKSGSERTYTDDDDEIISKREMIARAKHLQGLLRGFDHDRGKLHREIQAQIEYYRRILRKDFPEYIERAAEPDLEFEN